MPTLTSSPGPAVLLLAKQSCTVHLQTSSGIRNMIANRPEKRQLDTCCSFLHLHQITLPKKNTLPYWLNTLTSTEMPSGRRYSFCPLYSGRGWLHELRWIVAKKSARPHPSMLGRILPTTSQKCGSQYSTLT